MECDNIWFLLLWYVYVMHDNCDMCMRQGQEHGGFFSAVTSGTGLRSLGDLGRINNKIGGGSNGSGRFKRTFSEMGRVSSTVTSQQFIFVGGDDGNSRSAMGYNGNSASGGAGDSNTGLSRNVTVKAMSNNKNIGNAGGGGSNQSSFSLFSQIGAKRTKSLTTQ